MSLNIDALWLRILTDNIKAKILFPMCNGLNTTTHRKHKVEYWISNSHRCSIEQGTARHQIVSYKLCKVKELKSNVRITTQVVEYLLF